MVKHLNISAAICQETRDADGKYFMREILKQAKEFGNGWVTYRDKKCVSNGVSATRARRNRNVHRWLKLFSFSKRHWCKAFVDKAMCF